MDMSVKLNLSYPAAAPQSAPAPVNNDLQKNLKLLGKWAKREGVDCYRVYDADMPE